MDYDFMSFLTNENSAKQKYKLQIPSKCTTPRRGPLQLTNTTSRTITEWQNHRQQQCLPPLPTPVKRRMLVTRGDAQKPHMLTRFSVLMPRRPLEELNDQLTSEGISCLELQANIHRINIKDHFPKKDSEFHLAPTPSTYSRSKRLVHTHSSRAGPMNISITVTRHSQRDQTINDGTHDNCEHHDLIDKLNISKSEMTATTSAERPVNRHHYQSIAPLSLNAMVTQQMKPITANTYVIGRKLVFT